MSLNEIPVRTHAALYPDLSTPDKPLSGDIYISLPMKIGKHEWRVVVFNHLSYGTCTRYEWRRLASPLFDRPDLWKQQDDWPCSERARDNFWGGMPKSLMKLYRHNEDAIKDLVTN